MNFERDALLYRYVYGRDGKGTPLYTIKFPEDYTGERTLSDLYKLNTEAFEGITYMISCYMVIAIYQEYYWEGDFTEEKIISGKDRISWAKVIDFEGKKTIVVYSTD